MSDDLNLPPMGGMSGTTYGYTVEARWAHGTPKQIGDTILHKEWQSLHFNKSPIGIPPHGPRYGGGCQRESMGLLSYAAAEALRWWFIAEVEAQEGHVISMDTRLVAHKITYKLDSEALNAMSIISGIQAIGGDIEPVKPEPKA